MSSIKPNFFIVGAPKCATSAMHTYLAAHPDIFVAKKELEYFGSDFTFLRRSHNRPVRNNLNSYLSFFESWNGETCIGDVSLLSRCAAQEIKKFAPDAKIIIQLRNPVEMMYANYHQQRLELSEELPTFEAALEAEAERKNGKRIPKLAAVIEILFYRELASYTKQITRYFDVFGRDNVHVIIFDDLKTNTAKVYRKTLEFLEVDPTFETDFAVINPSYKLRNKTLARLISRPPHWYKLLLTPGKMLIPKSVRNRFSRWSYMTNTRTEKREPMDFKLRQQLQREFRPEVQNLSDLLERDLTHWCED